METLGYIATIWSDPSIILLTALGTFAGIYVGAIPGLSVTMAVTILMSFTFRWEVDSAMALMIGVYMGGVYGGARSAILLNIPGTPSSIATSLDGYPLAKKGEAGQTIGLATLVSGVGGFVGIALLVVGAPFVSEFALRFQPRDYFLVALLGLLLVGTLSRQSLAKGIFCAAFGIWVGTIGLDTMTAKERFTFGELSLWNGISPVVAMIGLFGVAEAFRQLHDLGTPKVAQAITRILPEWRRFRRYIPLALSSGLIGSAIGALPGAGGDIASLIAYDFAKRTTKNPEVPFGEGAREGVVAPEAANNGSVGGAFIPMLTLGIPGDAVTAVFIGAMFIHGLNPGPLLLIESPHIFTFIATVLMAANIFMVIFGLGGVRLFTRIAEAPKGLIIPLILVISVVGAYSIANSIADVYWVLLFGVVGYVFKRFEFDVGPIVLGIILSRIIEDNIRRTLISAQESVAVAFSDALGSPLTLTLMLTISLLIFTQTPLFSRIRARLTPGASSGGPGSWPG